MQILKLNSKGNDVKELQRKLNLVCDGIFGKITEDAVKKFQAEHNLIVDGIVGAKTWELLNSSHTLSFIQFSPLSCNITKRNKKPLYIIIHYTAGVSSDSGYAKRTKAVFESGKASADFVIDNQYTLQLNPDLEKYYCWAVGDGKGKYGITNENSISIEMCCNLKSGKSAKYANHDGWYLTNEVIEQTIKLTKELMSRFNIPKSNVLRHFDASGKLCPGIVGWNTGNLCDDKTGKTIGKNNDSEWLKFKTKI